MKTVTNGFKEQITKLGREIDFKIFLHTNDKIIAQDGKFLMTEDNLHLVVEQLSESEIDETITGEDIYSVSLNNKGNILSTMMKEFDFEIKQELRIGDMVDCSFGLKVGDSYEYVNYGRYIVYSKEFNEDTKTYSYVGYDAMLLTMQEIPDTSVFENVDLYTAMQTACNTVGITVPSKMYLQTHNLYWSNFDKVINEGTFTDLQMTYRDLLDMICQALGMSMIVNNKQLQLKPLKNTNIGGQPFIIVDTFDETFMKDINVSFGEKYGPINSVVLSRSEDNDNIYRRDEESIEENGLCEFKIKDNPIMLYDDREDYIQEIFNALKGTEFYINDFTSTGITYLDWLDFYNVTVGDKIYKCLMLNDEIKIQQGLEETIYTEQPEETVTDYKTSSKTDKEVSFIVDKQNGSIRAKVNKGDVINEINLDESGAEINADKISLAGKTIQLTSDNIAINSTNFQVDKDGNMTAKSGTFKGDINTDSNITIGNDLYVGKNQASTDIDNKKIKMSENTIIDRSRVSYGPYYYDNINIESNKITFHTNSSAGSTDSIPFSSDGNSTIVQNYNNYIQFQNWGIDASTNITVVSDKRLKQNIKNVNTSWIDELKVKEFEYIKSPNKKQIGLIAQDYENKEYGKYFLNQDKDGYYSIAYGNITNALIQYCQEMKKEINSLKEEIAKLKESDK